MTRRLEKLYQRVASAPANAPFEDVVHLAEAVGFVCRRIRGSHRIFQHQDHPAAILTLEPRDGQAKPYQVAQLLGLIEEPELRRW